MSRFVSEKTKKLELENGEFVEIKTNISYAKFAEIMKLTEFGKGDITAGFLPILKYAISSWNLKDEDGNDVPCTAENIDRLDAASVLELANLVMPNYAPDKKKLKTSEKQ